MDKTRLLNISISTRIISQLGEQLISDELVALMELIKNAYDADATKVTIKVDTKAETSQGTGKIEIEDNGNGMTPYIIEKGFLRISTRFKEEYRVSPYFKRLVLGNKGLGRLAFNRLGRYVTVTTSPRKERIDESQLGEEDEYNQYKLFVDWENLAMDQDFDKIQAKLESFNEPEPTYGTKIEILGIKNKNFWVLDEKQKQRLKNEIFGMINPFTKDRDSKFEIYLNIDGEKFTTEEINEQAIDNMSYVKTSFEFTKDWMLNLSIRRKDNYIQNRIISNKKNSEDESTIFKELERNIDNNIYYKEFHIDLKDTEKLYENLPKLGKMSFDIKNDRLAFPGIFKGTIYATDFSSKKELIKNLNSEDIKTTNDLDKIWEQANGVYVFRNEFRILPYGKQDWLDFTKRSQRLRANIYRAHTIAGHIDIDGESSENLTEQTNRQGFVEDEYGNNFFKIVKDIIAALIVEEDIKFRDGFELDLKNNQKDIIYTKNKMIKYKREISKKYEKEQKKKELEKSLNESKNEDIKKIAEEFFDLDSKVEQESEEDKELLKRQIDEIKDIAPMVGQAIIVESMTHELNRIEGNIKQYAKNSLDIAYKIDDNFGEKKELVNNQHYIIDETTYMRSQLNHLEPTYRSKKNIYEIVDVKKLLEESYKKNGPMAIKARNENVNVDIIGDNFKININRGYLITIFDNLFLNSLYWISSKEEKSIHIEINSDGSILFWDSGDGIHPDMENRLFDAFTTMKKDGRGLGLYIVTELLEQMNANISLEDERKNGRLYKFKLNFSALLED